MFENLTVVNEVIELGCEDWSPRRFIFIEMVGGLGLKAAIINEASNGNQTVSKISLIVLELTFITCKRNV